MDENKIFQAELMAYNSKTGKYEWIMPKVLASSIYMEDGQTLDQVIKFTPDGIRKLLEEILDGAPEAYNSFKEVADALDENKNSIGEIFREISKRVKRPDAGDPGQILKLSENGEIIFADPEVNYPVESVNSKTGAVTITKSDLGLGMVENIGIKILTQSQYDALSSTEKNRTDMLYGTYKE